MTQETKAHHLFRYDDAPENGDPNAKIIVTHQGFVRNGNFWNDWMPALRPKHRVVRPDLWGVGRSPDPGPDFTFTVAGAVQDLIGLVEEIGRPVNQIAESTGGMISAVAAATRPDLFESLTLISTQTIQVNKGAGVKAPGGAATPSEAIRTLGVKQWYLQSRAMTDGLFGDERDEYYSDELALTRPEIATSLYEAVHQTEFNIGPLLHKITMPVLVMSPGQSFSTSREDQQKLAEGIPNATWKIYEDLFHDMYLLQAKELSKDAVAFIDSL